MHFHVRPRDSGCRWVVDRYDGRGSWSMTDGKEGSWSIQEARRVASKHTRLAINDGFNRRAVNRKQCTVMLGGGRRCQHIALADPEFCALHGEGI